MEKYKQLLELIEYKKVRIEIGDLLSTASDERLIEVADELNVISVKENTGQLSIHLSNLSDLFEIDTNPEQHEHTNSFNGETYIHYKTEANGIVFVACKRKTKEEHKKAQAI